ncbi:MAG: DUF1674 domain-containing protein [Gammaproteobacteria bacterium]
MNRKPDNARTVPDRPGAVSDEKAGDEAGETRPDAELPDRASNGRPNEMDPTETRPKEIGGPSGPEPTRYGDWEHNGRCSDF